MISTYSLILKIFLSLRKKIQYKFYIVVLLSFCASFLDDFDGVDVGVGRAFLFLNGL